MAEIFIPSLTAQKGIVFDVATVIKSLTAQKLIVDTDNGPAMCFKVPLQQMADFLGVNPDEIVEKYRDADGEIATSSLVTIWCGKSCGSVVDGHLTNKPTHFIYTPAEVSKSGKAHFCFTCGRQFDAIDF